MGRFHRKGPAPDPHARAERLIASLALEGNEAVLRLGADDHLDQLLRAALPKGQVVELASASDGDHALLSTQLEQLEPAAPADAALVLGGVTFASGAEPLFRQLRTQIAAGGRIAGHGDEEGLVVHLRECAHAVAAQEPYALYIAVPVAEAGAGGAEDAEAQLFEAGFSYATCRLEALVSTQAESERPLHAEEVIAPLAGQLPEELRAQFKHDVAKLAGSAANAPQVRLVFEAVA